MKKHLYVCITAMLTMILATMPTQTCTGMRRNFKNHRFRGHKGHKHLKTMRKQQRENEKFMSKRTDKIIKNFKKNMYQKNSIMSNPLSMSYLLSFGLYMGQKITKKALRMLKSAAKKGSRFGKGAFPAIMLSLPSMAAGSFDNLTEIWCVPEEGGCGRYRLYYENGKAVYCGNEPLSLTSCSDTDCDHIAQNTSTFLNSTMQCFTTGLHEFLTQHVQTLLNDQNDKLAGCRNELFWQRTSLIIIGIITTALAFSLSLSCCICGGYIIYHCKKSTSNIRPIKYRPDSDSDNDPYEVGETEL